MIKVAAAVIVSDGKILAAKRKNERLGAGANRGLTAFYDAIW